MDNNNNENAAVDLELYYGPDRILKGLQKALNQKNLDAAEKLLLRASKLISPRLEQLIKIKLLTVVNCEDDKYVPFLLNFFKFDDHKLWDCLKTAIIKRDVTAVKSTISLLDEDEKFQIPEESLSLAFFAFGRWRIDKRLEILKLIKNKVNPNNRDEDGLNLIQQFLDYFAEKSDTDLIGIVEILGEIGIPIREADYFKNTPLHYSIHSQNLDLITYFIDNQEMDVNAQSDVDGDRPIHLAAEYNNESVIDLLCKKGADIHLENSFEQTAIHIAKIYKNNKVVDYLVARGANDVEWPWIEKINNYPEVRNLLILNFFKVISFKINSCIYIYFYTIIFFS